MKPNVDLVNLIAIQELGDVVAPDINDYLAIGRNEDLLSKRITVNNLAQLISSVLGSGSILPERVYRIGTSLPAGAALSADRTTIYDPYLDGKIYSLNRRGVELSIKGIEWDNDVINPVGSVPGGFRLLTTVPAQDTFSDGETVILTFQPQFSPYIPTVDAIARFTNGEQIITASSTITAGMYRKLIVLEGATSQLTITLPLASSYPANVALFIISNSGSHIQATLNCAGADVIKWRRQSLTSVFMGINDQICLIPTASGWRVQMFRTDWDRVGTIDFGYMPGPNQFISTGANNEQLRADYPRVWDFIKRLAIIQPNAVVSGAVWASNKGLWGTGNGTTTTGTTFNFPHLAGRFPRYLDPSGTLDQDRFTAGNHNKPGSFEADAFKSHAHLYNRVNGSGGNANFTGGGTYDPGQTEVPTSLTGQSLNETRGINVGGFPLINI